MRFIIFLFLFASFQSFSQDRMPNLIVKDLQNKPVHINKDFNEVDKIYIFSFWATWCAPCISELEAINEHYAKWSEELNMELIAVSTDDSRTQRRVRPLLNGKNWPYQVLMDTNQDLKRALSIVNIPYMVVVKNQKIELIFNGYTQGAEEKLYQSLKTL
ncbi:TlpA family protein disulfide reductase [Psychroflexus sp. MES1-P1E]|uniref:TlpA family protein disulfide reductase n=1 Tax=Psychroflexus sp. MES1-P1E TaxID=2058320 RepID=UPI000C7C7383|nr:TlpA disulfide reductase family protein [Psychroflexus sp. MES1-P1E]PKG42845.1 thiol:disulfide interchange protein [Psychroflexus sp. MES1-P1E]